jgi:hypothetical protein
MLACPNDLAALREGCGVGSTGSLEGCIESDPSTRAMDPRTRLSGEDEARNSAALTTGARTTWEAGSISSVI